jgi:hypothetical protein
MKSADQPSACMAQSRSIPRKASHYLVGRNRAGQWVARDSDGRCGGLFASRTDALRFALREGEKTASAVVLVPHVLDLFASLSAGVAAPEAMSREIGIAAEQELLSSKTRLFAQGDILIERIDDAPGPELLACRER